MSEAVDAGATLQPGDAVLFIDRKEREYLRTLRPGKRVTLRNGWLAADSLIGLPEGTLVYNSSQEPFLMLRPTYAHLVPNLPRRAQVIYPKDVGPILLWGDIYPGATVIEVGVGPAAMTIALLRAVGTGGHVISYEAREEFAAMARENVERFHGPAPNWTVRVQDAFGGFVETGVDRMVVDLAEPWHLLPSAADALRLGGVFVGYVPTVLQVKHLVDHLHDHPGFGAIETMETLVRFWHVKRLSVRPEHRMVAHTGFIVVARRVSAPRGGSTPEASDEIDEVEESDGSETPDAGDETR